MFSFFLWGCTITFFSHCGTISHQKLSCCVSSPFSTPELFPFAHDWLRRMTWSKPSGSGVENGKLNSFCYCAYALRMLVPDIDIVQRYAGSLCNFLYRKTQWYVNSLSRFEKSGLVSHVVTSNVFNPQKSVTHVWRHQLYDKIFSVTHEIASFT